MIEIRIPPEYQQDTYETKDLQFMLQRFFTFPEFPEFLFHLGKTLLFLHIYVAHEGPSLYKTFFTTLGSIS